MDLEATRRFHMNIFCVNRVTLKSMNPASITSPMTWEFELAVSSLMQDPIDITFKWSADVVDSSKDIVLEEFEIGPLPLGSSTFTLDCDGPALDALDAAGHILEATCLTVSLAYHGREVVHVGVEVIPLWANAAHEAQPPEVVTEGALLRRFEKPIIVKRPVEEDTALPETPRDASVEEEEEHDDDTPSQDAILHRESPKQPPHPLP